MNRICFKSAFIVLVLCTLGNLVSSAKVDKNFLTFKYTGSNRDIAEVVNSKEYELQQGNVFNLGVSNEYQYLKITVPPGLEGNLILNIDNSTIDEIQLFALEDEIKQLGNTGQKLAFAERGTNYLGFSFNLSVSPTSSKDFLLKLKSGKQLLVPIRLTDSDSLALENSNKDYLMFLYFGILIFMFIYNGFLAVSTKDLDYVYYIFYIFSVGLTQVVLFGYGDKYLWPNSSWLSQHCVYLLGALSGLGTIFFVIRFIKIAHYAPTIHKILKVYIALEVAAILLAVLGYFNASYNLINFNAATSLILLVAAIKAARQGFRSAKFFLLAWTIFLVSVTLYAFKDFGILPYNYFTVYALPFGSAIEGILLSFALADKINTFKKDKEDSQERMISVMKENQSLIEQQNIKLEAMVHERTQDLERANDDLSATLNDLKMTQKQLLESEKLASLGQMTAGIAHEINNPINFVSSNIQPLKRDVSDILTLLDEYAQVSDLEQMREKLPTLQKRYKDLDIDYLKREIDMLLHGIEEGSRRTAEIVRGLRIFSRMDRDALVTASINECLGSTLVVMKSVTKGEVTLVREMQDDLPAIDCYPGKLNQVFMNIINNAVQATKLPGRTTADRQVTIKTFLREDNVCISVTDNGCGIPEDVRSKIFDPFFTTKGVGEGTGLGLSIAMGIINEHHGRIEVSSEPNKGTEFLIILPRKMAMSKAA